MKSANRELANLPNSPAEDACKLHRQLLVKNPRLRARSSLASVVHSKDSKFHSKPRALEPWNSLYEVH